MESLPKAIQEIKTPVDGSQGPLKISRCDMCLIAELAMHGGEWQGR